MCPFIFISEPAGALGGNGKKVPLNSLDHFCKPKTGVWERTLKNGRTKKTVM